MSNWISELTALFYEDSCLDEILINGTNSLVEVRGDRSVVLDAPFKDSNDFEKTLQKFAFGFGLRLDPFRPCLGGSIDGPCLGMRFRWHIILKSICPMGPLFSLRRHRFDEISLTSFAGWNIVYRDMLENAIVQNIPVIIAGETGSGKTTFLSALLYEYCSDERVVFLEQYREISIRSRRWVSLHPLDGYDEGKCQISFQQIFSEVLRMRPDRIVLGEARGQDEGKALADCLLTGHGGVLSSVHIDHEKHIFKRLRYIVGDQHEGLLVARDPLIVMMDRGNPPKISSMTSLMDLR